MNKSIFYITTPIYYVNDKPHIGHAYTTVAADILARWHKQKGDEVFFLTGTDEHGAKVAESAKKANKLPQQFCDENSQLFRNAFDNLNLSYDYFIRTTDKRHEEAVAKFMQKLYDQGDVYEGSYEGLYCTGCEDFITEKELVDGKCPDHLKVPEKISEKNYFFKLTKYLAKVQELIEKDEIQILPEDKKKEALGLFKQGLSDFSVSRENVEWGIPLPFDKSQVTYVWVEALQNYISAIGYGDDRKNFEKWWQNPFHIMAKDILKFHCVYWPALLLAVGEKPPKQLFLHGFFSINGQKMSKSIGNVIDPNDLVTKYGADATRYLLISQFPFGQDGDIKQEKFDEQFNSDLANGLGNIVSRVANLIELSEGKIVPKGSDELFDKVSEDISSLKFHDAIKKIFSVISELNGELQKIKPWEMPSDSDDRVKFLERVANELLSVSKAIWPFMPDTAKQIEERFLAKKITKGKPLFPRI
ncbi:MAG: class I tRNA ligase family protein [Patescibacteria group bacterium]|jgi:methionyl-tRNA synthetase